MSEHKKWSDFKADYELLFKEKFSEVSLETISTGEYWKVPKDFKWKRKDRKQFEKERIEFGYATHDWWSFDTFLAAVIAHGLERFASESHGHPGDKTIEEWKDRLHEIAEPLKKWACEDRWKLSYDAEMELYEQVQDSIRDLADIFGHLWD